MEPTTDKAAPALVPHHNAPEHNPRPQPNTQAVKAHAIEMSKGAVYPLQRTPQGGTPFPDEDYEGGA